MRPNNTARVFKAILLCVSLFFLPKLAQNGHAQCNLNVTMTFTPNPFCPGDNVTFVANVTGGTPPYSYAWGPWPTGQPVMSIDSFFIIKADSIFWFDVHVTDNNGCHDQAHYKLTPPLFNVEIDVSLSGCGPGDPTTLFVTPQQTGLQYLWSTGSTDPTIPGYPGNNYSVTVTNVNGCTKVLESGVISLDYAPTVAEIDGPDELCANVLAELNALEGTNWVYDWSNGGNNSTTTINGPGLYSVTVTNTVTGCTDVADFLIATIPPNGPVLDFPPSLCPNTSDLLEITNSSLFTQFAWNNGQNSSTIAIEPNSAYTVTVTEPNGCTAVAQAFVQEYLTIPPVITALPDICEGQEEWEWQVVPSFATYQWSTGESSPTINISSAGTYSLTVTDVFGCTNTTVQTVEPAPMPAPSIPPLPAVCDGGSQLVSIQGGPFASYNWSTGANSSTIMASQAGTYSVTVTNTRGCTATAQAVVSISSAPTATISLSALPCQNTAQLSATGGGNYLWNTGETTPIISTNANGNYAVTVTNGNGCTATSSIPVSLAPPQQVQVNGPVGQCTGSQANLAATPGLSSYQWSNGATGANITVSQSDIYTVTATDAAGCTTTASFAANFYPLPTAAIIGPSAICTGTSANLEVSGNFATTVWSTGATTPSISTSQTGTYAVTVTNAQGCTTTASQQLAVGNGLAFDIVQTAPPCNGTASLSAPGGMATYLWSTGASSPSISVSQPGNYTVTISDASGCSGADDASVAFAPPPSVVVSGPNASCAGQPANLAASSGFASYAWSNGATTANITVSQSGTYAVTATDAAGCTATANKNFDAMPLPDLAISGPAAVCFGEMADLVASGSFAQLLWSNGATTPNVQISQTGIYTVVATDANGCTRSASKPLEVLPLPTLALDGPSSICIGNSASFTATGNFAQLAWSTGQTGNSIAVTQSGSYSVTATAANGCSVSEAQTLNVSATLTPTITPNVAGCNPLANLNAGLGYANYAWSNGSNAPSINVDQAGNYSVTVSDASGCTGTDEVAISFPAPPAVDIIGTNSICTGGTAVFAISGNFQQVAWSNGQSGSSITVTLPGAYSVTATDANGCVATATHQLDVTTSLSPQLSELGNACNGVAILDASVGAFNSYQWSNGATTPTISVSQPGVYTVTVSDASGCTGTAQENVSFPALPQVQIIGPSMACVGTSANLLAPGNFSNIAWSNGGTGSFISVSQPGNYQVTVTDANGCTATDEQAFAIIPTPLPNIIPTNIGCNSTGTLTVTGLYVNYQWSDGTPFPDLNITQSGIYMVTVTDIYGCTGTNQYNINLPPPTQAGIIGSGEICEGHSETLSAPANFTSYLWSNGQTSPQLTITGGGQYGLTVTDGSGCTATAVWDVTELPTQYAFFTNSSCSLQDTGTVVTVLSSTATGCDSVVTVTTTLSPGLTGALALAACPGAAVSFNGVDIPAGSSQEFVLTSSLGCDSLLTVSVAEHPVAQLDWEATPSCWNDADGTVSLAASAGTAPYQYAIDGGSFGNGSVFGGLPAGQYLAMVTDGNGCLTQMPFEVATIPPTIIELAGAKLYCGQPTATLAPEIISGSAPISWQWSNGVREQVLAVSYPGEYVLTANDGCEVQTFSALVEPADDWNQDYFFVPNSFSPNGDATNDHFMALVGKDVVVRTFEFKVFDRWGNAMYITEDPYATGWDGLHQSEEMRGAVFAWYLKAKVVGCDGKDLDLFREGGVHLVR